MTLRAWAQENPGKAITAAAITGGTIVYLALKILTGSGTGDEPPIRVKGGSIHFELVTTKGQSKTWSDTLKNPGWTAIPGTRNGERLGLFIIAPDSQCDPLQREKNGLTFTYTNNTDPQNPVNYDVTLDAKTHDPYNNSKRKSTVTPPNGLTLKVDPNDGRNLVSVPTVTDETGFISKITWGNGANDSCSFVDKELQEVYVFEW